MAPTPNKGFVMAKVPRGMPIPGSDLTIVDHPIDLSAALPANALLLKNHYLSFDPYQRGRMRPADTKSYNQPFDVGAVIVNSGVSSVLKSSVARFKEGDLVVVFGACGTEEYTLLQGEGLLNAAVSKLENPHGIDERHFIGALGMPGLTAYSSFYEIARPKKGETILVSAAAGAVGQLVGQLAKHEGLTVIGSVGDDEKLKFITEELGFDAGFNYKKETPGAALKRLAPQGIDIYYENVGGDHLAAAMDSLRSYGRIVACGMISQYNLTPAEQFKLGNLTQIVQKRLTIRGFIVGDPDMGPKYREEHMKNVARWIADGSFKAKVSVTHGIDNAAEGFVGMLSGKNFGKAVLDVSPLDGGRGAEGKL